MNKILIIGQAPAYAKQTVPYDTTMLYDWLSECGISKSHAQNIFEFEAVSNTFPGFNQMGHKKPSSEEVAKHWPILEAKLQLADRVLILGGVAAGYYDAMPRTWSCAIKELYLIHPSKRNYAKYKQNKAEIIAQLKEFLV